MVDIERFQNSEDQALIIGAGPVGLSIARGFLRAGIPYVQVEATDHVGGNWAHGVYETAHIISSRRTTELPDHPMPADYPDFPSAAQMRSYFEGFARDAGLLPHIRFGAEVEQVRQDPDERWAVRFKGGVEARFKAVIVCNGHHWKRSLPAWVSSFGGEVLHSKDYKRPEQLAGKRVLVVGGGNSACDLVSEAARVSASADWSLRRGYWFLPKTLFGVPSIELIHPWVPVFLQRLIIRAAIAVVVGDYARYGLPKPEHRIFEAHPTVNSEVFHYLKHGRIRVRRDVAEVRGQTVRFTDGEEATYDTVACATGFDLAFPFLPEGAVPVRGKVAELWAGGLRPEYRHLYVVGTSQPRYGIGPLLKPLADLLPELYRLQDELTIPLGELLRRLGERPPDTHLMDPHAAMRQMAMARRMLPVIRWRARKMGVSRPASAPGAAVTAA